MTAMQVATSAGPGVLGGIDRWIDRFLALGADAQPFDRRPTLRAFEKVLLLHLSARLWYGAFAPSTVSDAGQMWMSYAMTLCFAMLFVKRLAPLAIGGAFCVMLAALWGTFPMTSNHLFLELWTLLLLVVVGGQEKEEANVWVAVMRWSIAIMLFYSGVQKVLYGAYFSGQFLIVEMILKPEFSAAIGWMLSPEEWERLRLMIPNNVGVGPYKTSSPLLLLATNSVYLFEMTAPVLLLWKRTRRAAVLIVFVFVVAIQGGAREAFFAGLMANLLLLFWPANAHRHALPVFAVVYVLIGLARAFYFGDFK